MQRSPEWNHIPPSNFPQHLGKFISTRDVSIFAISKYSCIFHRTHCLFYSKYTSYVKTLDFYRLKYMLLMLCKFGMTVGFVTKVFYSEKKTRPDLPELFLLKANEISNKRFSNIQCMYRNFIGTLEYQSDANNRLYYLSRIYHYYNFSILINRYSYIVRIEKDYEKVFFVILIMTVFLEMTI